MSISVVVPQVEAPPALTPRRILLSCAGPALIGFILGAIIMAGSEMAFSSSVSGRSQSTQAALAEQYLRLGGGIGTSLAIASPAPSPMSGANGGTSSSSFSSSSLVNPDATAASASAGGATGPIEAYLENTAIVTMATGDTSARLALTLMQSLRDSGTRVPKLVVMLSRGGMGSANCNNDTWRRERDRMHISCGGPFTTAAEIASEEYLTSFERLGVEILVVDPIPDTKYTIIPGGRQIFWGMAFNKLLVFNMSQYRKLLWMDADAYVVRNLDHLMKEPMFTGALVSACCHPNGPGYAGGGIWVVEPSLALMNDLMDFISKPVPGTLDDPWHWGDMQVMRHYFGSAPERDAVEPLWPAVNDLRHGYAPGLRYFPKFKNMTEAEWDRWLDEHLDRTKQRKEGFIPELWDKKRPAWIALDLRYDQCVGHFQCSPERDDPSIVFSVHFSCLHDVGKPGNYDSEHELLFNLYTFAESQTRYWFLRWYETYKRAHGRLPPPFYTGPAVPGHNQSHDLFVMANRIAQAQKVN